MHINGRNKNAIEITPNRQIAEPTLCAMGSNVRLGYTCSNSIQGDGVAVVVVVYCCLNCLSLFRRKNEPMKWIDVLVLDK